MGLWMTLVTMASCYQGGFLGVTATVQVDALFKSADIRLHGWGIPDTSGSATMDPELRLEPALDRFLYNRGVSLEDLEIQDDCIVLTVRLPLVGRRRIRLQSQDL